MLKSIAAVALVALAAAGGAPAAPLRSSAPARASVQAATALGAKGTVTAVSSGSLSIRTAKGKALTFHLTADTRVENLGAHAALADVKTGAVVKVEYAAAADGSLTASSVTIGIATPAGAFFSKNELPSTPLGNRIRVSARSRRCGRMTPEIRV